MAPKQAVFGGQKRGLHGPSDKKQNKTKNNNNNNNNKNRILWFFGYYSYGCFMVMPALLCLEVGSQIWNCKHVWPQFLKIPPKWGFLSCQNDILNKDLSKLFFQNFTRNEDLRKNLPQNLTGFLKKEGRSRRVESCFTFCTILQRWKV